jgi:hypothetical protein
VTPDDLNPTIRSALALHEGMRRLGFAPADIYLRTVEAMGKVAVTVIRGGREANILAGPLNLPVPAFLEEWTIATKWWNEEATEAQRSEIWQGSSALRGGLSIIIQLQRAGFAVHRPDA